MAIAVLNYGYQFVAGRVLSPEEYGMMYSLFSAGNIALLIGVILQTAIAKTVAVTTLSAPDIKATLRRHCAIQAIIAMGTTILMVALGYSFLDSTVLGIYIFGVNLSLFWIGMAQGYQRFKLFSVLSFFVPLSKILASLVLILGWHYDISFLVCAAAGIAAHFVGGYIMKKDATAVYTSGAHREILKTFFASLVPLGTLAAFSFMHNITAKAVEDDVTAGAYCLAALLGTAMIAIPSAVTPVVVPYAAKEKNNKILLVALGVSEGLAVLGGLLFLLLKEPLLTFMFKENGVLAAPYVLPIFIMFIPLVAFHVLDYYLVAIGKKKLLNIVCGIAVLIILIISFTAKNMYLMSYAYTAVYFTASVILGVSAFKTKQKG